MYKNLIKGNELNMQGFRYMDDSTYEWCREFHVDDHSSLQDLGVTQHNFGGNLSVRRPPQEKPIISMGQDECIFKQYAHTPKAWTSPEGKRAIIRKDDGLGVMISAFVTSEWGFNKSVSPFVQTFEYGANAEGYWQ